MLLLIRSKAALGGALLVIFKAVDSQVWQFWSFTWKSPTESSVPIVLNLEVKRHIVQHHWLSNIRLLPSVLLRTVKRVWLVCTSDIFSCPQSVKTVAEKRDFKLWRNHIRNSLYKLVFHLWIHESTHFQSFSFYNNYLFL